MRRRAFVSHPRFGLSKVLFGQVARDRTAPARRRSLRAREDGAGKPDDESRAAFVGWRHDDRTALGFHELLCDPKAEARAGVSSSCRATDARFEDALHLALFDAGTGIGDRDLELIRLAA